ncbi:hypothetical protein ElyMa_006851800 [Elysia marginata]|uniref:ITPR-interacting domain-containing protein n=1 Tax=Elysia marginata TaxID=1093978 RepID=A0AAV4JC98_9GAST|nr:hypothetical protein ElyMa_006851800 [Elysia marginata]
MEAGGAAGLGEATTSPSTPEPAAQNPTASTTANRSSPKAASAPIAADSEHKPTNGQARSLGVTKGADTSGDSGIGGGDGEGSGGGGGGFASLARKLTSKGKGVAKPPGDGVPEVTVGNKTKQNGCSDDLDLPLGSEAYSISSLQAPNGIDSTSRISVGPDSVDSHKAAAQCGMMGWQSFNSDVSTSAASTASLDMLLNDRLVDPEEVLFNLGFGGPQPVAYVPSLARIPQRFLQAAAARAAEDGSSGDPHPGLGGVSTPDDGPGSGGGGGGGGGGLAAAVQALQQQQGHAGQMGRKRTGGFCVSGVLFLPCHGYVDLARLVRVYNIPLVFFNREGSKCYRRVRLRSVRAAAAGEDTGVPDGSAGENAVVDRRKSSRKSKRTIRRRKTGGKSMHQSRSWIESVEEEEVEKGSETKTHKETGGNEVVGKSVKTKACKSSEETTIADISSINDTEVGRDKAIEHRSYSPLHLVTENSAVAKAVQNDAILDSTNAEPQSFPDTNTTVSNTKTLNVKKIPSPEKERPSEKTEKAGRKKFFNLSYMKMAAKKLGDAMSGKLSKSRMYDLGAATTAADQTGHHISDIVPEKTANDSGSGCDIVLEQVVPQSCQIPNQSLRTTDQLSIDDAQRLDNSDPGDLNSSRLGGQSEKAYGVKGLRVPELKRHAHTSSHPNLMSRLCMAPLLGGYVTKWSGSSSTGNVYSEAADKHANSDNALNRRDDSQMDLSPRCHSLEPEDERTIVEGSISQNVSSVVYAVENQSFSPVESCDTDIVCNITVTSPEFSSFHPENGNAKEGPSVIGDLEVIESHTVKEISLNSSSSSNVDVDKINSNVEGTFFNTSESSTAKRHQSSDESNRPLNSSNEEGLVENLTASSNRTVSFAMKEAFERPSKIVEMDLSKGTVPDKEASLVSSTEAVALDVDIMICTPEEQVNATGLQAGQGMTKKEQVSFNLGDDSKSRIAVEHKEQLKGISEPRDSNEKVKIKTYIISEEPEGLENARKEKVDDGNDSVGNEGNSVTGADVITSTMVKDDESKAGAIGVVLDEKFNTAEEEEGTDVAPAGSLGPDALIDSAHRAMGSSNLLSMLGPSAGGLGFLLSLGLPAKAEEEDNSSEVSSEYGRNDNGRAHDDNNISTCGIDEEEQHLSDGGSSIEEDEESVYDDDMECDDDEEEDNDNDYDSGNSGEDDDFPVGVNIEDIAFEYATEISNEVTKLGLEKVSLDEHSTTSTDNNQVRNELGLMIHSRTPGVKEAIKNITNSPDLPESSPNTTVLVPKNPFHEIALPYKINIHSHKPFALHLSLENLNVSSDQGRTADWRRNNSFQQRHPTLSDKHSVISPITPEITLTSSEGVSHSQSCCSFQHSLPSKRTFTSRSFDNFPGLKNTESSNLTGALRRETIGSLQRTTGADGLGSLPRLLSASSSSLASNSSNSRSPGQTSPRFLRSASPTTALFLKLRNTAPPSSSYAGSFLPNTSLGDQGLFKGTTPRNSLTVDAIMSLRAITQESARTDIPIKDGSNTTAEDTVSVDNVEQVATIATENSLSSTSSIDDITQNSGGVFSNPFSVKTEGTVDSSAFPHTILEESLQSIEASNVATTHPINVKNKSPNLETGSPSSETAKTIPLFGLAQRKRQDRKTIDFDPRAPRRKLGTKFPSLAPSPLPEDTYAEFALPTPESRHAYGQLPPDVSNRRESVLMRRRTSTGCIMAKQNVPPALASSSSAEWAWLLSSRRPSDDLDRLSATDQAELDLSNVSTSSDEEDSESDSEDRRPSVERWDELFSRPRGSVIFGL